MDKAKWYYENDGESVGPVSTQEIRGLLLDGVIDAETLIWNREIGASWRTVAEAGLVTDEDRPPILPRQRTNTLPTGAERNAQTEGQERSGSLARFGKVLALLLVLAAATAAYPYIRTFKDFAFPSDLSCSSPTSTATVTNIAKQHLDENIRAQFAVRYSVNVEGSGFVLEAIRTQRTDKTFVDCAAFIRANLAFEERHTSENMSGVKDAFEKKLSRDIIYRVELTDKGDQIYVTVHGLVGLY